MGRPLFFLCFKLKDVMNMIIAGIDASTTATGVCVMQDGEILYRTLIAINPSKEKDAEKRIKTMLMKMCTILDQYDIDAVYMEKAICKGGNVDTTIKLAYLSGGIYLYCAQNGIEFHNPLPTEWRKRIGISQGRGVKRETQKAEAIFAVKREYGINVNDDVAEAILLSRSAFDLPNVNVSEDNLWGE
jgi:Holliday junction resolvasome RuvABC endonuclease subunit